MAVPLINIYELECQFLVEVVLKFRDRNTNLLHSVSVTYCNCAVFLRLEVISYAERSTDLILSSVSLTDVSSVIELAVVVLGKFCIDLLCALV